MTNCSRDVFVRFHEAVNHRAALGYVPFDGGEDRRVHIVLTAGPEVGRPLCNIGAKGAPFVRASLSDAALPCMGCFDKALGAVFRHRRRAEEQPGRL